jgi:hypothetical protein
MSTHLRTWLAIGALLALSRASAAEVSTETTSSPRESPRALNGHVYQPFQLLTGPFTETSFGMTTIFGGGTASAPRYDLQGNVTGTRDYDIAAYGQALDLHLRLTPDIAARLAVSGLLFSGINGRGILVVGATAQFGVLAGLTAGRDLTPTMRLSGVVDFGLTPQLSVLVGNAVLRTIQDQNFDESGLFSNVERVQVNPGASFAWSPSPVLGFIAEARYVMTRRVSKSDGTKLTGHGVSLGGAASLDLDPLMRWPFTFQASYRGDLPVGNDGIGKVHQAGLGAFYSRRVRLALGLEAIWRHGVIRPGVEPTLTSDSVLANIWFRYYW